MLRFSHEEPTGVWVCGPDGERVCLTFANFVAAIEDGALRPDDRVWSRIVTGGRWVRAADMRLYRLLADQAETSRLPHPERPEDASVWPPPPSRP